MNLIWRTFGETIGSNPIYFGAGSKRNYILHFILLSMHLFYGG